MVGRSSWSCPRTLCVPSWPLVIVPTTRHATVRIISPPERPCRFCAGMPVRADIFVRIQGSLRQALEAVSSLVVPEGVLQGCPIHQGVIHGGEAERLRSGIEAIIEAGDAPMTDLKKLLDHVEAGDSLGHLERIDLATGIATLLADESLSSAALRGKLQSLLDGISLM